MEAGMGAHAMFTSDRTCARPSFFPLLLCRILQTQFALYRSRLVFWKSGTSKYTYGLSTQNKLCAGAQSRESIERYKYLASLPDKYFIAANFHNNEAVLPDFIAQLLQLVEFFGPDRLFVSVFESGSKDKTLELLRYLDTVLEELGVPRRIVLSDEKRDPEGHRIEYLAHVRNEALKPLYETKTHFSQVIFLNDIFFCADDIKELLHQTDLQDSDITCGLDFGPRGSDITFYDNWVAHDMDGNMFGITATDFVGHKPTNERLKQGLPFQVSCCWNGVAVLNARAFSDSFGVKFRRIVSSEIDTTRLPPQQVTRFKGMLPNNTNWNRVYESCSVSECSNLCWDFANKGFDRMVVVPRVRVTYDFPSYSALRTPQGSSPSSWFSSSSSDTTPARFPLDTPFKAEEDEPIKYEPMPLSVFCLPLDEAGDSGPDWGGFSTAGWVISNKTLGLS
ncbi:capsular associated protein [Quaeritorhiza haematococci]|nr:capsular associated protein [Quaeritorhiza haematococci]